MNGQVLETQRMRMRRFVPEDLDALFALYRDPEMVRYIPDAPAMLEEARRELEWHRHGPPGNPELGLWATVLKESGRLVGRCGLLPWNLEGLEEVEVAFLIERASWGRGLGTEAAEGVVRHGFERLGLSRLVCFVEHGNEASKRVAEKIGMRFEREASDEHGPFLLYSLERGCG